MNNDPKQAVLEKLQRLERMPSIPAVLYPLIKQLEQPAEDVNLDKVVDLISQDVAMVGQCLQMANSPLFGRAQEVESVRSAVIALGIRRMHNIAMSCCILKIIPPDRSTFDPLIFWEHSLGCALLCRHFAISIGFPNPEKAYLAGLLHDLGIIVNIWVLPQAFKHACELARSERIPLHEAELRTIGITHCESGKILAERWHFSADLTEVMKCHHDPESAQSHRALVALVSLNDLLCRMWSLGYGHGEDRQIDFREQPAFALLHQECPALSKLDWARFTFELESRFEEVQLLVNQVFRAQ